jgi:hypothetical protein
VERMKYGSQQRIKKGDRRKNQPHKEGGGGLRLLIAALVFTLCLVGRMNYPAETEQYRQKLAELLSSSTDFQGAFRRLGKELSQGDDMLEAVGDWCISVFAPEDITLEDTSAEEADTSS